ncbi:MAG: hypothetical protein QXT50_00465 [Thermofilum sp.]
MASEEVIVVGAGLAGLSLARELGEAIVIEARSRPGGFFAEDTLPVEGVTGKQLVESFLGAVKPLTELTAFKVRRDGVWVVGVEGARLLRGAVVGATGFREKTAVELGVYGHRPAGVWYLTAAWELAARGYSLGDRVLVYGLNHFSLSLVEKLRRASEKVYVVFSEPSLVHPPDKAVELGAEPLRGRVKRVEGAERVESVKTSAGELRVDALILAVPAAWNPLGFEALAGNAAMVVEHPLKVVELSRIVARALRAGGDFVEIDSSVPVYPRRVPWSVGCAMVAAPRGARIRVDGKVVEVEEPYPVVELPKAGRVRLEVL